MQIKCDNCGKQYNLDPSKIKAAVVKINCPNCKNIIEVTKEAAAEPPKSKSKSKPPTAAAPTGPDAGKGKGGLELDDDILGAFDNIDLSKLDELAMANEGFAAGEVEGYEEEYGDVELTGEEYEDEEEEGEYEEGEYEEGDYDEEGEYEEGELEEGEEYEDGEYEEGEYDEEGYYEEGDEEGYYEEDGEYYEEESPAVVGVVINDPEYARRMAEAAAPDDDGLVLDDEDDIQALAADLEGGVAALDKEEKVETYPAGEKSRVIPFPAYTHIAKMLPKAPPVKQPGKTPGRVKTEPVPGAVDFEAEAPVQEERPPVVEAPPEVELPRGEILSEPEPLAAEVEAPSVEVEAPAAEVEAPAADVAPESVPSADATETFEGDEEPEEEPPTDFHDLEAEIAAIKAAHEAPEEEPPTDAEELTADAPGRPPREVRPLGGPGDLGAVEPEPHSLERAAAMEAARAADAERALDTRSVEPVSRATYDELGIVSPEGAGQDDLVSRDVLDSLGLPDESGGLELPEDVEGWDEFQEEAENAGETAAEPVEEPPVEEPAPEALAEPVEEPPLEEPAPEALAEPVEEPPVEEPAPEALAEPVEEPPVEEPAPEALAEPVEEPPVEEPAPEALAEPVEEPPVEEPAPEALAEPVEEPPAEEPAPEAAAEPVVEPLVEDWETPIEGEISWDRPKASSAEEAAAEPLSDNYREMLAQAAEEDEGLEFDEDLMADEAAEELPGEEEVAEEPVAEAAAEEEAAEVAEEPVAEAAAEDAVPEVAEEPVVEAAAEEEVAEVAEEPVVEASAEEAVPEVAEEPAVEAAAEEEVAEVAEEPAVEAAAEEEVAEVAEEPAVEASAEEAVPEVAEEPAVETPAEEEAAEVAEEPAVEAAAEEAVPEVAEEPAVEAATEEEAAEVAEEPVAEAAAEEAILEAAEEPAAPEADEIEVVGPIELTAEPEEIHIAAADVVAVSVEPEPEEHDVSISLADHETGVSAGASFHDYGILPPTGDTGEIEGPDLTDLAKAPAPKKSEVALSAFEKASRPSGPERIPEPVIEAEEGSVALNAFEREEPAGRREISVKIASDDEEEESVSLVGFESEAPSTSPRLSRETSSVEISSLDSAGADHADTDEEEEPDYSAIDISLPGKDLQSKPAKPARVRPMVAQVHCPNCQAVSTVDSQSIPDGGTTIKCPGCKQRYFVEKDPTSGIVSAGAPPKVEPTREKPTVTAEMRVEAVKATGKRFAMIAVVLVVLAAAAFGVKMFLDSGASLGGGDKKKAAAVYEVLKTVETSVQSGKDWEDYAPAVDQVNLALIDLGEGSQLHGQLREIYSLYKLAEEVWSAEIFWRNNEYENPGALQAKFLEYCRVAGQTPASGLPPELSAAANMAQKGCEAGYFTLVQSTDKDKIAEAESAIAAARQILWAQSSVKLKTYWSQNKPE